MSAGKVIIGVCVVVAAVYFIGQSNNSIASGCIAKEEDKDWSFLTFANSCDQPINVVFCSKMAVGELGKFLGYATGEWNCQRHHAVPNQSFTTIKWVNDRSSVASHIMSTSQYQVAACKAPFQPRFTEGTTYVCEKG